MDKRQMSTKTMQVQNYCEETLYPLLRNSSELPFSSCNPRTLNSSSLVCHNMFFATYLPYKLLRKTSCVNQMYSYFVKSEASCAFCHTNKRTICLFQHHLPRPCKIETKAKGCRYSILVHTQSYRSTCAEA